jgi:hypothetical protein
MRKKEKTQQDSPSVAHSTRNGPAKVVVLLAFANRRVIWSVALLLERS